MKTVGVSSCFLATHILSLSAFVIVHNSDSLVRPARPYHETAKHNNGVLERAFHESGIRKVTKPKIGSLEKDHLVAQAKVYDTNDIIVYNNIHNISLAINNSSNASISNPSNKINSNSIDISNVGTMNDNNNGSMNNDINGGIDKFRSMKKLMKRSPKAILVSLVPELLKGFGKKIGSFLGLMQDEAESKAFTQQQFEVLLATIQQQSTCSGAVYVRGDCVTKCILMLLLLVCLILKLNDSHGN